MPLSLQVSISEAIHAQLYNDVLAERDSTFRLPRLARAHSDPAKSATSAPGTKETVRPALPNDCFRPETGPAADAPGGRLMRP
jgi:hypothetical protein